MSIRNFNHTKVTINGNTPPDEFLNLLIDKANSIPHIAEVNPNHDIFSVMRDIAGKYTSIANRKAWMCEGLRCLASLESSYNWLEGKDPNANNTSPQTMEAGIFQCSANSMVFGSELQKLFTAHTGLVYSQGDTAASKFRVQTMNDHEFAVEYMMLLCRIGVDTHGPLLRKEINKYLSLEAVKEFEGFMSESHVPEEPPVEIPSGIPPRPRNYDDIYRIFGNPRESGWSNNNLAFCPVNIPAFPLVSGKGRGFYCNKLLVGQFKKCFDEIIEKGLSVYDFSGCYNLRAISGSSNLSLHSWAIAVDINYDGNELGDSTPAMDLNIVAIFKKNGFFWGGDYRGRKDPMHFEWYSRS